MAIEDFDQVTIAPAKLRPFSKFIMSIGELPTSYLDSLSYAEQITWFCDYLQNNVIPALNNNATALQEVQNLMTELQEYVNDYFDNLDVQEEINNKLDQMAEDGTLTALISGYVDPIINGYKQELNAKVDSVATFVPTLNLGRCITYDIPDNDVGHMQGMCQNGQYAYVGVQGSDGINGYIYVFNILDNTYFTRYNVDNIYHANDLAYLDNKIYIASLNERRITVYDITNGSSEEIDPFAAYNAYQHVSGLEIYNGKLLCCLENENSNTINNDKYCLLNLTDYSFIEYTISDPNKIGTFTSNITRQSFTVDNDSVYILMQNPNIIYNAVINDNNHTIVLNKFYNVPLYDDFNNALGETEGISVVRNTDYPEGMLMLNSRSNITYENTNLIFGQDTINLFFINPKSNVVRYPRSSYLYPIRATNTSFMNSVSKVGTSLKEIGNAANPFRNIIRGINSCTNNQDNNGGLLFIRDSGSYHIPYLINKNIIINVETANATPTIYLGILKNCKITFRTNNSTSKITLKPMLDNNRVTLYNTELVLEANATNIEINNIQFSLYESVLKTRRCVYIVTTASSSGYDISLDDNSLYIDGVNTWTTVTANKIQYGGNSIVVSPLTSGIVRTGIGVAITMTQ